MNRRLTSAKKIFLSATALCVFQITLFSKVAVFAQEIKYIETSIPDLLNPVDGSREVIGVRLLQLLYRGLIDKDRMGEWQPVLALDMPEYNEIDKTLTFKLKTGIQWPDGQAITAKDVVHSFKVYVDARSKYGNVNILDNFEKVEAVDNETIKFYLKRADRRSLARTSFFIMPSHILGDSTYIAHDNPYNRSLIGAGPYVLKSLDENSAVLEVNSRYYKMPPSIQSVQLITNPVEDVHKVLLQSGHIDLDPVIRPQDLPEYQSDLSIELLPYDSQSWYGFAYNCEKGILQFKEVRQALSKSFNRAEALRATFADQGTLISGPYTHSSFSFNPQIRPYEYDPLTLDALLDSLQIVDTNGDGIREFNGESLVLHMVLSMRISQDNKDICANFVQQLKAHGIEVIVDYQEQQAWYEKIFYSHNYDITFVQWKFDEGSNIYPLFSKTQKSPGMFNIVQFDNDEVEILLDRFRNTEDDSERTEIGMRLHELLHEESPYTFLWTLQHGMAYRADNIRRINIHPFNFFNYIDEWLLEE
jgi:peptide/nickel transport system substrate-binding protein